MFTYASVAVSRRALWTPAVEQFDWVGHIIENNTTYAGQIFLFLSLFVLLLLFVVGFWVGFFFFFFFFGRGYYFFIVVWEFVYVCTCG